MSQILTSAGKVKHRTKGFDQQVVSAPCVHEEPYNKSVPLLTRSVETSPKARKESENFTLIE